MQLITINHLKLSFKLKVGGANLVFSTVNGNCTVVEYCETLTKCGVQTLHQHVICFHLSHQPCLYLATLLKGTPPFLNLRFAYRKMIINKDGFRMFA